MTNFYSKMCYIPNFFLLPQAPSPAGRPQRGNPSPQTPRLGRSLPNPPCWGSPKRLFVYSLFTVYELFTKCLLFTVYCLPIRGNLFTVYDLFTNSWDHKLFINMFISYKLVNMWHWLYLCFIPIFILINVYKLYYLNSFIDFNFILSHGTFLLISNDSNSYNPGERVNI